MKNHQSILNSILFLALFFLAACNAAEEPDRIPEIEEKDAAGEGRLVLRPEQVREAAIQFGSFTYKELVQPIKTNGVIELPPNNIASISSFMDGFIHKIRFLEGATVRKGDVLAEMKNPDFVRLQQDYVQAFSRFDYLEQELHRQQTLNEAEVGAKKQLQQVQSEYRSLKATLSALKEQMAFLGIQPDSVMAGNIQNTIYLKAPFHGTVTSVTAHRGEMIKAGREIMEIINRDHMHLELQVFQKDIPHIKSGLEIRFTIPAFEDEKVYQGKVALVGKNLDPETKTIRVHGHFDEDPILIPGLYVEAQIIKPAAKSRVLPEGAVIRDRGKYYFFVKEDQSEGAFFFNKVAFDPGITSEGFVQVKNFQTGKDTMAIVIDGAFYLKSEMNKTEEAED